MGNGCSEKEADLSCLDRHTKKKSKFIQYSPGKYGYDEPYISTPVIFISIEKKDNHNWFWQVKFIEYIESGYADTLWQSKDVALKNLYKLMTQKCSKIAMEIECISKCC